MKRDVLIKCAMENISFCTRVQIFTMFLYLYMCDLTLTYILYTYFLSWFCPRYLMCFQNIIIYF